VHFKLHFSPQSDRRTSFRDLFLKTKKSIISAPVRLIDGLTPDLNISVLNRLIWERKSIGVKVVMNASSDGGYTVTNNGKTDHRRSSRESSH
jgi:hypothetical protein